MSTVVNLTSHVNLGKSLQRTMLLDRARTGTGDLMLNMPHTLLSTGRGTGSVELMLNMPYILLSTGMGTEGNDMGIYI